MSDAVSSKRVKNRGVATFFGLVRTAKGKGSGATNTVNEQNLFRLHRLIRICAFCVGNTVISCELLHKDSI